MAISTEPTQQDLAEEFGPQEVAGNAHAPAAPSVPPRRGFGSLNRPQPPAGGSAAGVARLMGNAPAQWQQGRAPSAPAAAFPAARPAAPAPAPAGAAGAPRARGFGLTKEQIAAAGVGISAPPSLATADEVEHLGVVERISIYNDWGVGSLWNQERVKVKLVGTNVVHMKEGLEYLVRGRIKPHASGDGLEVTHFEPHINPDIPSMLRFIINQYQNVGVKTATRFLHKIRDDEGPAGLEALRQKLVYEPWEVSFESVTNRETTFGAKNAPPDDPDNPRPITEAPELPYVERFIATRFGRLRELKSTVVKALSGVLLQKAKELGDKSRPITETCVAVLIQDPYSPIRKIPGYGFMTADAIGREMNIPRDAPVRLSALAGWLVGNECQDSGHTFISEGALRQRLAKAEPLVTCEAVLEHGVAEGDLVVVEDAKRGRRIYPKKLYDAEQSLARDLHDMLLNDRPLLKKQYDVFRAKALEVSQKLLNYELDEPQIKALYGLATSSSRLHLITAGPGCGKTAIMEVFAAMMGHKRFAFGAPTGKAAKVLTSRVERQGYDASTINSLLQGSVEDGFGVNRTDPLDVDVLVIDEATMPELGMFAAITAALGPRTHLVVLGDPGIDGMAGQLPSIGPGRVMSDLVNLPGVDHHHLTAVKRNSGGILETVDQIRSGVLECEDCEGVTFSHVLNDASEDFQLLADRYLTSVAAKGIENVVLLMSRRNGEEGPGWNTDYANARLRDLVNPGALRVPGSSLHVGDRIIIRKNATLGEDEEGRDIRVVNGDTGTLLRFQAHPDPKQKTPLFLLLKLDDSRIVQFPGDSMSSVQHSYALTVHSSQGSEYKEVLLVMTPGQASFMNQNMMLTGASRPKEHLWVFGNDAELRKIASTPLPPRNSTLVTTVVDMLKETLDQNEAELAAAPKL